MVVFAATSLPLNLRDVDAYGFASMDEHALRRQDALLQAAGASDTSRAILWYDLAGGLYDFARLDPLPLTDGGRQRAVEEEGHWLNERIRGWQEAPLNRITSFAQTDLPTDGFSAALHLARMRNTGDAPRAVVDEYRLMAQKTGAAPRDSLYVSALVAPWTNLGGSPTELAHWKSDPAIRFRDLLSVQAPIAPPAPGVAASDTAFRREPGIDLLPPPDDLHDLFARLLAARTWEEVVRTSQRILMQDLVIPQVSVYRQLIAAGRFSEISTAFTDSLLVPDATLPHNHPRSQAVFEQRLLPVRHALATAWVAAQYTPDRPNPMIVVARVQVDEAGAVCLIQAAGNIPDGRPVSCVRKALELGVTMPAYERADTFDIVFIIDGE